MKTIDEIIVDLKTENPVLQFGNDETGYKPVSKIEYEQIIQERAQWRFNRNQERADKAKAEADKAEAKASAQAKLTKLGLTEEEVATILG
jgi:hypothetical protein